MPSVGMWRLWSDLAFLFDLHAFSVLHLCSECQAEKWNNLVISTNWTGGKCNKMFDSPCGRRRLSRRGSEMMFSSCKSLQHLWQVIEKAIRHTDAHFIKKNDATLYLEIQHWRTDFKRNCRSRLQMVQYPVIPAEGGPRLVVRKQLGLLHGEPPKDIKLLGCGLLNRKIRILYASSFKNVLFLCFPKGGKSQKACSKMLPILSSRPV